MAKLSTQRVRQDLIDNILSQDKDVVAHIVQELDKELDRIYKDLFGFTDAQIAENKKFSRSFGSEPVNIINQYFHLKGDKWLRQQHKIEFQKKEVA
jgi:hypothetical protein